MADGRAAQDHHLDSLSKTIVSWLLPKLKRMTTRLTCIRSDDDFNKRNCVICALHHIFLRESVDIRDTDYT